MDSLIRMDEFIFSYKGFSVCLTQVKSQFIKRNAQNLTTVKAARKVSF